MPRYYLDLIDENGTRVRIVVSPEQLAMLKVGDNRLAVRRRGIAARRRDGASR